MEHLSRREREERQHREDILRAAEKLFLSNGFYQTTINDIAREAEFGVGTIYKFFENKEKLYLAVIVRKIEELDGELYARAEAEEGTLNKIRAVIDAKLRFFERNGEFFRVFMKELAIHSSEMRGAMEEELHKRYASYIDFVAGIFKRGIEEGVLKKHDPRKMAYALDGMLNSFIGHHLRHGQDLSGEAGFVFDLFASGVVKEQKDESSGLTQATKAKEG